MKFDFENSVTSSLVTNLVTFKNTFLKSKVSIDEMKILTNGQKGD